MLSPKSTSTSIINYGSTLPATAADGALFYKTDDVSGLPAGLYVYRFKQDTNPAAVGDQVGQGWFPAASGLYVELGGDEMFGPLTVPHTLRVMAASGPAQRVLLGTQAAGDPVILEGNAGRLRIGSGTHWTTGGSLSANFLEVDPTNGPKWGSYPIWHGGNDGGSGSAPNAATLAGQAASFYRNASNINAGQIPVAHLPFMPVQQGGGSGQGNNKINIGWSTADSKLRVKVDGTSTDGSTWPIDISGNATSATTAATATTAVTATTATAALALKAGGTTAGANLTFNTTVAAGTLDYIWGTSGPGATSTLIDTANLVIGQAQHAVTATTATSATQVERTDGTLMSFNYQLQSGMPSVVWGTNDGVNITAWDPSQFIPARATRASTIDVTSATANSTFYVPFVANIANSQAARGSSTFTYNPSTDTVSATTFNGTAVRANYADLAEMYTTDAEYPIGTVMVVNGAGDSELTASSEVGSRAVGVISENPAFLMNQGSQGQPVALKGKVRVRVWGPVVKGQELKAGELGCAESIGWTERRGSSFAVALETNLDAREKLVMCVL